LNSSKLHFSNTAFNFSTNLAKSLISMIIGLVLTPFLVTWLGDDIFAQNRLLLDLFSYVGIFELGLVGAIYPLIINSLNNRDGDFDLYQVISYSFRIFLKQSFLLLVVSAVMFLFLNFFFNLSGPHLFPIQMSWGIYSLILILFPINVLRIYFDSIQKISLINILLIVQLIVVQSLCAFLAWKGFGLIGQISANVVGIFILNILIIVFFLRSFDLTKLRKQSLLKFEDFKKRVWELNWNSFAQSTSGKICLYTDNVLVGLFWGVSAVTPFFLCQKIVSIIQQQLLSIGSSSWASLIDIWNSGDRSRFEEKIFESNKFIMIASISFLVPVLVLNKLFIQVWIGLQYFSFEVTLFAIFVAIFQSLISFWGWLLTGSGKLKSMTKPTLIYSGLNLCLSVLFSYYYKFGPLLGTVVALVFYYNWSLGAIICNEFRLQKLKFFMAVLQPILLGFISYFVLNYGLSFFSFEATWVNLVVLSGISFVFMIMISVIILLNSRERKIWLRRFRLIK